MRYEGQVVKRRHGVGSKSDHDAVYLDGPQGQFKLRLPGANPFRDSRLDSLVGKSIVGDGEVDRVSNQLFLYEEPVIVPPKTPSRRAARKNQSGSA